jgi:hypothetical protein
MKGFNGLLKKMHTNRILVCQFYLRQFTKSHDASGAVLLAYIRKTIYFCCCCLFQLQSCKFIVELATFP